MSGGIQSDVLGGALDILFRIYGLGIGSFSKLFAVADVCFNGAWLI